MRDSIESVRALVAWLTRDPEYLALSKDAIDVSALKSLEKTCETWPISLTNI